MFSTRLVLNLRKTPIYCSKIKDLNRLKVVLVEQKKTGKWLAEQLGKSFSIVNAYACNRRQPSLEQLFEIAKILQVEPKELIANK